MIGWVKRFYKANNFPWITCKKYFLASSTSELLVDVAFPIVLSGVTLWLAGKYVADFKALISIFQQLSGQVIAAISILAGFNIASITIIASAGNVSQVLRNRRDPVTGLTVYETLIIFFTWAVVIQLVVVLLSILLFYSASIVPVKLTGSTPIWAWISAEVWMTLTLHSIFVSIRNMKTLYLYVMHAPPTPPTGP